VGNGGPDVLNAGAGNDTVLGGAGDDVIYFNPTDQVFGGAGFDALVLFGRLSLTLTHADATSIEEVLFSGDGVARIYSTDDFLAAHKRLIVNAEVLAGDHTLRWFGGAETDGHFKLIGSRNGDSLQGGKQSDKIHGLGGDDDIKGREGKDVISGGAGNDLIAGGRAADMLSGGAGNDTFAYTRASHSTGLAFDTIARFDAQQDSFLMFAEVSQIDPKITKGSLSHDTFDHDLAMATNLAAHHAVLFKPSDGDFAGHIFLVIDQNGVAGYQSGHDVVIELAHAKNMGDFSLGNFV
jgi:Ca2+-binding RTX toxin-like protein